jgi:hypothetical protein
MSDEIKEASKCDYFKWIGVNLLKHFCFTIASIFDSSSAKHSDNDKPAEEASCSVTRTSEPPWRSSEAPTISVNKQEEDETLAQASQSVKKKLLKISHSDKMMLLSMSNINPIHAGNNQTPTCMTPRSHLRSVILGRIGQGDGKSASSNRLDIKSLLEAHTVGTSGKNKLDEPFRSEMKDLEYLNLEAGAATQATKAMVLSWHIRNLSESFDLSDDSNMSSDVVFDRALVDELISNEPTRFASKSQIAH